MSAITPDAETCLLEKKNITMLSSVYEGIPETLLINFVTWMLLLVLFSVLRKRAGDYGRLALVHIEDRWTRIFYGRENSLTDSIESASIPDRDRCAWIPMVFRLKDSEISQRCGPDALHYLSFQRRLAIVSVISTVIALCVILPVNFQGSLEGDSTTFGHTTVNNLKTTSPLLWVHVISALCLASIVFFVMKDSSGLTASGVSSHTLLVVGISPQRRDAGEILHRFRTAFPEYLFERVEIAREVEKLTRLTTELENVIEARARAEIHLKRTNEHLIIRSTRCCSRSGINAVDFYREEEARLLDEVERERSKSLSRPLGIAFVTMSTPEDAAAVVARFGIVAERRDWTVSLAPPPSDIIWENIGSKTEFWYVRAVFVDLCLFISLFFLTTPAIIVNTIDSIDIIREDFEGTISPVVSEFLATLLLWTLSALMPVVVANSELWLRHWFRSEFDLAVMRKTFAFLLFAILILPSLGLTSIRAFVEWSLKPHEDPYRWECLFLPDKGAFFVNYVITSALIGTALELLRFSELFLYAWRRCLAKSSAEIDAIKRTATYEFPYGVHYAWTLVVFTTSTVYCLICPLIAPFGLLYLGLKHAVDRYNLYFAYSPRSSNARNLHATAVRASSVSIILLLATMAGLSVLRGGIDVRGGVVIAAFMSTVIVLLFCSTMKDSGVISTDTYEPDYVAPALRPFDISRRPSVEDPARSRDYGSSRIEPIDTELIPNVAI